jgi:aryl-alcohol dehydrogenase-like predicted oxidoreductase
MKPIERQESNIPLSFGCARIGGSVGSKKSLLALQTAFESGIVQYDVARSYGFGSAESVLGKFIKNKRNQVCVTTKFGIEPPKSNMLLNFAKPVARSIAEYLPFMKRNIQKVVGSTFVRSKFTPEYATICIEKSLKELQTDYIDLYLLHSCSYEDTLQDDLFALLQDFIRQGKIRAFGVSSSGLESKQIKEDNRQSIHYFQFESSLLNNNSLEFTKSQENFVFSNAPFERGNVEQYIVKKFQEKPFIIKELKNLFDIDITNLEQRNKLILQSALSSNLNGIVVCTMLTPTHIEKNVSATKQNYLTCIDVKKISQILEIKD